MQRKLFFIIPVKPFDEGKSRLAPLLAPSERAALNAFFFESTMKLADECTSAATTIVISRSERVLQAARRWGVLTVRERGSSLNAAANQATRVARAAGATSILLLPTDLPFANSAALQGIVARGKEPRMSIVSDQSGRGTNVLFLSPPSLNRYWFGRSSYKFHCKAGQASGLVVTEQRSPRLEFDVDTPEQYLEWQETDISGRVHQAGFVATGGVATA